MLHTLFGDRKEPCEIPPKSQWPLLKTEVKLMFSDFLGSQFWKQNSRKIYAVPESDFVEFQNGRRAKTR